MNEPYACNTVTAYKNVDEYTIKKKLKSNKTVHWPTKDSATADKKMKSFNMANMRMIFDFEVQKIRARLGLLRFVTICKCH